MCGDGKGMAPAVAEVFRTIYRAHAPADAPDAAAWLAELVAEDRYVEDVWAG